MVRTKLLLAAGPVVALVASVSGAYGASSQSGPTWDGIAPFGQNEDGSPAAELISPSSSSIDLLKAANANTVECLRRSGFEASVLGDGRFGYSVEPTKDGDALEGAVARCQDLHPVPVVVVTTGEEWEALYVATLRQAECLEQNGAKIPDPPPERAWIGSQGATWDPDGFIAQDRSTEEYYALLIACPAPR